MPRLEWMARFDLVFAPNFLPPPTAVDRLVVTVHDLAFRLFPGTAPGRTLRWLHRAEQGFHRARRIIAVSDCTKGDLLATYGIPDDRVEVIPHGVDHEVFRPPPPGSSGSMGPRLGVEGPYLLFLGGIEPRKNLPTLLRAYARLPENVRPALILAGSGVPWNPEGRDQLEAALRDLPGHAADRVVVTGYVPESEKVHLLQGAAALVYPSLYEGFGLPVLEAMACGTPVLTSNASALPEVAGDAALLVDPRNTDAIEEGMEKLLTNQDLRARLREAGLARAQGFTWDETARRTMNVLHRAGRA